MGPITVTTVTEQHRWGDSMMMSPTSMSKGRDKDELTMDVDLEEDGSDEVKENSKGPVSVRTFEAPPKA